MSQQSAHINCQGTKTGAWSETWAQATHITTTLVFRIHSGRGNCADRLVLALPGFPGFELPLAAHIDVVRDDRHTLRSQHEQPPS